MGLNLYYIIYRLHIHTSVVYMQWFRLSFELLIVLSDATTTVCLDPI